MADEPNTLPSVSGDIFREFYNENSHRFYPFAVTNDVPTGLIVGLGIIATTNFPLNTGADTAYISKIVTDGTHIRFYMGATINKTDYDFGCIATVNVSEDVDVRTNFQYVGDNLIFEGFIVTGNTLVAQQMPGVTTLGATSGKIHTTCIQHMSNWVAGINVGGTTYGGILNLEAGPGVSLDVVGNTLKISCTGAIMPDVNGTITSDDDILQSLQDAYGIPITSINGQEITGGDWNIICNETDGITVTPNAGTHSITITNENAKACCTQDDIALLVDNISELNERVGLIQSFQTQLETGINILSAQVSRVM